MGSEMKKISVIIAVVLSMFAVNAVAEKEVRTTSGTVTFKGMIVNDMCRMNDKNKGGLSVDCFANKTGEKKTEKINKNDYPKSVGEVKNYTMQYANVSMEKGEPTNPRDEVYFMEIIHK